MTVNAQMHELRIVAEGVVKDKDGNVISNEPIEAVRVLSHDEAMAFLERQNAA